LNYKEIKPLIPSSVILTWTYLINFQNRKTPEKQEIELNFISHASHFSPEFSYKKSDSWFQHSLGMTLLKIKHTARSWGTDIESLLSNHVQTYEKDEPCFRKWCRKHSTRISVLFFLAIFFIGLIGLLTTTHLLTEGERYAVEELLLKNQASLDEKVNFLINHSLLGIWPKFFISSFLFVSVLIVGGIFVSAVIEEISQHKEPSFIVISKTSKQHKTDVLKRLNKKWKTYIGTLIGGVLSGIIANIIFTTVWIP